MSVKLFMLPLFLTGALMVGCEDNTASQSPDATINAKAADAKAAARKDAADTKAAVDKAADDAKAAAKKVAADASAAADQTAANVKAAAEKAAADAQTSQAARLLTDLKTAVTGQKWADAGAIVKQLDDIRGNLAAEQKAVFDSLKKQYEDNKPRL
jgi:hypothetical protein